MSGETRQGEVAGVQRTGGRVGLRVQERLDLAANAERPGGRRTFNRGAATELQMLLAARVRDTVNIDQPLVYITQMPRSGGTLLMRLFDGHPELHAVPHELGPLLRPARRLTTGADRAWKSLFDPKITQYVRRGYRQSNPTLSGDHDVYPFLASPALQRALFEAFLAQSEPHRPRIVLDAYFTSYFNAWLDNRNLRTGVKRWVTGFAPGGLMMPRASKRYFEYYPDGLVISIVRDPWSWWASARKWNERWEDRATAIHEWLAAAISARQWRLAHPDAVVIVPFDHLLRRTKRTMQLLAERLGIEFRPELLTPTFNGVPVRANSSFPVAGATISKDPLDRARTELTEEDVAYIADAAGEQYQRLLKLRIR